MDTFVTKNANQTRKLGELLAKELQGGQVICLTGELGSGKTTFTQGVLKGLGTKGPYTSPTFVVMKRYEVKSQKFSKVRPFPSPTSRGIPQGQTLSNSSRPSFIQNIYHVDCYRVGPKDIFDLGWKEVIADKKNIIIVEWAERMKSIIPKKAVWISFRHREKNERKITLRAKSEKLKYKSNN